MLAFLLAVDNSYKYFNQSVVELELQYHEVILHR